MIDNKYVVTTTTRYIIKYRRYSVLGKREYIRDIQSISVLLSILKPMFENSNIYDIVVEEKIINSLDEKMLQKEIL